MTIEDIVADFRKLGTIDAEIAKRAAPRIEAIAKKTAAAGTDPSGNAWKQRKKDGTRPLEHAAERVHAEANGNIVTLVVDGPEYWHQKAAPDASLPRRKVIPNVGDEIPVAIRAELDDVMREVLAELGGAT